MAAGLYQISGSGLPKGFNKVLKNQCEGALNCPVWKIQANKPKLSHLVDKKHYTTINQSKLVLSSKCHHKRPNSHPWRQ